MEDVKVEFELTAAQALALAQFVKRVRWTEVRHERAAHSTKKLGLNNHRSWPNQFSSTGTGFSGIFKGGTATCCFGSGFHSSHFSSSSVSPELKISVPAASLLFR